MRQTFITKARILAFVILLSAPLMASAQVEINEANFPDETFRSWLYEQDYGKDGVLTEAEINAITAIDVSWNTISDLKGIEHFTALTFLDCSGNQLTALDVSKNTALEKLDCSKNLLTALDVSKNTALTFLDCSKNSLTALDVSKNTALTYLDCSGNRLTALDVSKNTALTFLDCSQNPLTALDVSKNTALITLYCYSNQFTALDVSNNTALTALSCRNNQLTALDVSKNTVLTGLYCYNNQIKGASMDALIASLPQQEKGTLCVYDNSEGNEGNVCTKAQVAAAEAKGWSVLGD